MPMMRMTKAGRNALNDSMEENDLVVLLGEDIATVGDVFEVTEGLLSTTGPTRVRDISISEVGFLRAATTGLRLAVEMMYVKVIGVAHDQLVTGAAKMRYLPHGTLRLLLVVGDSPILVVHRD